MRQPEKIVQKPWGFEIIWAQTDRYVGKILHINKSHRLSRQYHEKKEETIRVLSGTLSLEIGTIGLDFITHMMYPGDTYHIAPGCIHRMKAMIDDVEVLEVSTPELEDVVRIEDDYMR